VAGQQNVNQFAAAPQRGCAAKVKRKLFTYCEQLFIYLLAKKKALLRGP
jgi:hypothetical protein